jgi:hypothetical protein
VTPTNTPSNTSTVTPSETNQPSNTPTKTSTVTPTNTPTNSGTPNETPTNTPTQTPSETAQPSNTPTPTVTKTPTNTPTNTITPTNQVTPSPTSTTTPTPQPSNTPTNTPSGQNTSFKFTPAVDTYLNTANNFQVNRDYFITDTFNQNCSFTIGGYKFNDYSEILMTVNITAGDTISDIPSLIKTQSLLTNTGGPFDNLNGVMTVQTIGPDDYITLIITDEVNNIWASTMSTFAQYPTTDYTFAKQPIGTIEANNIIYPSGSFNVGEIYSLSTDGGFNGCVTVTSTNFGNVVIYNDATVTGGPFNTLKDCTG